MRKRQPESDVAAVVEDSRPTVLPCEGALTIEELKAARVWCLWSGPEKKFIGTDGAPATADNLTDFATASEYLHWRVGDTYPPHYSVAIDLTASGLMSLALMDCYDEDRGFVDGAAQWAEMIGSYTEMCWRGGEERVSARILCRGRLPQPYHLPRSVVVQQDGMCPLTCMSVSPRPLWHGGDSEGRIVDATEALAYLCGVRKPQWAPLGTYCGVVSK